MFKNEASFESYIRSLIESSITADYPHIYALDSKKAVDIVISRNTPLPPALFFIEVKYHKGYERIGIGHGGGKGFQPEILKNAPSYFETNLRWVIASDASDDIHFVPSETIRDFLAGDGIGEKQNNIQQKFFSKNAGLNEGKFVKELTSWLLE